MGEEGGREGMSGLLSSGLKAVTVAMAVHDDHICANPLWLQVEPLLATLCLLAVQGLMPCCLLALHTQPAYVGTSLQCVVLCRAVQVASS